MPINYGQLPSVRDEKRKQKVLLAAITVHPANQLPVFAMILELPVAGGTFDGHDIRFTLPSLLSLN